MKKQLQLIFLCLSIILSAKAQFPSSAGGVRSAQAMNAGHFYGKIVDSKTNRGIEAASIQLSGNKFDTITKGMTPYMFATVITQQNGDFGIESLPVFGNFKLTVSCVGYKVFSEQISFNIKMPQGRSDASADNADFLSKAQQMVSMIDKDLGNIKLEADSTTLATVTVTSSKPFFEMGVDRKVFNVDKNIVSTGQTATEVMKQIPTLNVDIDGNVKLRNATPQIFIDDRPTTLTLDQIPSDIIDKVEIITNPSAKYDASGGQGGIINIVLKKNNKKGYNGGIRAGIDSHGKYNVGGDFNIRSNKINFFGNVGYNQRESKITSSTDRTTLNPTTDIYESGNGENNGYFQFFRAGFDYLIDNRNTLTLAGVAVHGHFSNDQPQMIDSTYEGALQSYSNVSSLSSFDFRNYGGQLSFKHNFAKPNHNISADINYNGSTNSNDSYINTYTFNADGTSKQNPFLQQTSGNGYNRFLTIQSDYENPLSSTTKLEAGVRAALRNFYSLNDKYYFIDSLQDYKFQPFISSRYKYNDAVYAAYTDYTINSKKWSYQLGLRLESSNYKGYSLDSNQTFKTNYPLSLFPSAYITYKINNTNDIQLNFSRRVNRPNFFQLAPIINIADPQNISVGNPALKPEFTNSFEASYDRIYKHSGNFLATFYFKYSTDLITNYVYKAVSPVNNTDTAFFNTYRNVDYSYIFGLELTNKLNIKKFWDLTLNVNFFESKINGENIENGLENSRLSWFAKMNNSFTIIKGLTFQLSGNYQAKTVLPPSSGGNGPGGFFQPVLTSAQGYIAPFYSFDAAIKKEWTWKGGNTISASLSMNDIFRTQLSKTYSTSDYFTQITERRRDPQLLRLNLSYRFGKLDANLFKRKNVKADVNALQDATQTGQ